MERKNSVKSLEMVVKTIEQTIKKKETESSDCLVCVLRPFLIIGAIVGVSPIAYNCPHRNKQHSTCSFQRSNLLYVLTVCIFCLVIFMLGLNVYFLLGQLESTGKDKITQLATLVLFELSTIVVLISVICQINEKIKELNGVACIMENKELFCLEAIFDEPQRKCFRKATIIYSVITVILLFGHTSHIFYFVLQNNFPKDYVILRGVSSCLSLAAQIIYIFTFILHCKIYRLILQKCYDKVKISLDKDTQKDENLWAARSSSQNPIIMDKIATNDDITSKLQKLQRLHCALIINMKQWNKYLNPMTLLTIGLTVLMLILSYYLLISLWLVNNARNNGLYYMLEFKTLAIIGAMTYMLIVSESLLEPEGDVLSFLEGYPISKLQPQESLQAEMLITTVRVLRPQLSASGVFNISIGLIASILSTIVSYVLVALQFHASWAE